MNKNQFAAAMDLDPWTLSEDQLAYLRRLHRESLAETKALEAKVAIANRAEKIRGAWVEVKS